MTDQARTDRASTDEWSTGRDADEVRASRLGAPAVGAAALRAPEQTDAKNDRPNEPLDHGLPSVNEPDEADGAMEEPGEAFRSREEIEALRVSEGPGPGPSGPAGG
jgi:hypothetical protein